MNNDILFNLHNSYVNDFKYYTCYTLDDSSSTSYICYFFNSYELNNNQLSSSSSKKIEYNLSDFSTSRSISDTSMNLNISNNIYYSNVANLPDFENHNNYDLLLYVIIFVLGCLLFVPFINNLLKLRG